MKLFQGFQKAQLNNLLDKKIYSLNKYDNFIKKIFRNYYIIYKKYDFSFREYLKYLSEIISEMDSQLKSLINKHIQLEYDVDALLNKNINMQNELERLIDMRNFLYRVKHKDEIIPDIDSTLYIESKRYILAKCLEKLFKNDNNITVIKYLNNIGKIPDLNNIDNLKFIVRNFPPLLSNNINIDIFNNENKMNLNLNPVNNKVYNKKILKKNRNREKEIEKIREREKEKERKREEYFQKYGFAEPEELIQIITYLEDQNRFLLSQNENKRNLIEKYKDDLETYISKEDIEIEKKIIDEIAEKEKELTKIKYRHYILKEEYNRIYNIKLQEDLIKKNQKKKKISDGGKSSFADFNYFQTLNYNFQIKKAKYPGIVFFGKLLKYFINFLSMKYDSFTKEKFYSHIHPDYLNEILEYSEKMDFNDRNYFLIYRYILKLLKLYEYICEYVFKKDEQFRYNEKNIPLIKKEKDKIINKRKLDNARTIRILIENKRINANKQLIEKWMKPEKYISRKVDNNNYKILLRNKSQDDIFKRPKMYNIGKGLNDELNGFIEPED